MLPSKGSEFVKEIENEVVGEMFVKVLVGLLGKAACEGGLWLANETIKFIKFMTCVVTIFH